MRLVVPATILLRAPSLAAQVRWTPHVDLAARNGHTMAWDPVRQRVLMFGGGNSRDDLWEWDGTTWTARIPAAHPGLTIDFAMTFDPALGETVLFGGASYLTWTYAVDVRLGGRQRRGQRPGSCAIERLPTAAGRAACAPARRTGRCG